MNEVLSESDSHSNVGRSSKNFEDGSDYQQSRDELSESEKRRRKDEQVRQGVLCKEQPNGGLVIDDEMPTKMVKTENLVSDEEAYADLMKGSRKQIKRENNLDGQSELNERGISPTITFSSDGDPDDHLLSKFGLAVSSPKFKVAVGVEYEAPIQDRTSFYCYDFDDLVRINQGRMKAE